MGFCIFLRERERERERALMNTSVYVARISCKEEKNVLGIRLDLSIVAVVNENLILHCRNE